MAGRHLPVSIDMYAYRSGMRDWNSAYKVCCSIGTLITVIALDRILVSLVTLAYMMLLTTVVGKVKVRDYVRLLSVPFAFILLSGLAIALQVGAAENAVWSVHVFAWELSVTWEGIGLAVRTGIKALAAVSGLYLMTLSTPMGEILSVFRKMHVPDLILELMHLIYRYIFILFEQNSRQQDAARARLGYHGFVTSIRTFGQELANLFVRSMKKSGTCFDAMESRGYEGGCLFWEEEKPFHGSQALAAAGYAAVVLLSVFLGR